MVVRAAAGESGRAQRGSPWVHRGLGGMIRSGGVRAVFHPLLHVAREVQHPLRRRPRRERSHRRGEREAVVVAPTAGCDGAVVRAPRVPLPPPRKGTRLPTSRGVLPLRVGGQAPADPAAIGVSVLPAHACHGQRRTAGVRGPRRIHGLRAGPRAHAPRVGLDRHLGAVEAVGREPDVTRPRLAREERRRAALGHRLVEAHREQEAHAQPKPVGLLGLPEQRCGATDLPAAQGDGVIHGDAVAAHAGVAAAQPDHLAGGGRDRERPRRGAGLSARAGAEGEHREEPRGSHVEEKASRAAARSAGSSATAAAVRAIALAATRMDARPRGDPAARANSCWWQSVSPSSQIASQG